MKAVARLVLSYFTCTPALRVFSSAGLVALVISFYATRAPDLSLAVGMLGVGLSALAMAGVASIYVGSGLMPLMFGRLARSHLIGVLPWGRLKLLVSAFSRWPWCRHRADMHIPDVHGSRRRQPLDLRSPRDYAGLMNLVWVLYTSSILLTSWLYLAWFVTSERTVAELSQGTARDRHRHIRADARHSDTERHVAVEPDQAQSCGPCLAPGSCSGRVWGVRCAFALGPTPPWARW
jgi:hypothetical protein